MISAETSIDQVTVLEDGQIAWRRVRRYLDNGVERARAYERGTLLPGQSLADVDPRIAAVATAAWTPDVIAAWRRNRD